METNYIALFNKTINFLLKKPVSTEKELETYIHDQGDDAQETQRIIARLLRGRLFLRVGNRYILDSRHWRVRCGKRLT